MKYSLLLILAACGASPPPAPTSNTAQSSSTPAACGASYDEVAVGAPCTADGTNCAFPEGTCRCASQSYCGGVEPTEEMLAELAQPVWQCDPKRTDGCPEEVPSGACSTEGQVCTYGDCCIQPATCTNGMWDVGQASCPP